MIVRVAKPHDAQRIAEIHVASWQSAYRGLIDDAALDAMSSAQRLPMWQRILTNSDSPMTVLVAEDHGSVIGFASTGPSDEHPPDANVSMLYTIYVDPARTGGGVGTALLAEAERQMATTGARLGTLRVLVDNTPTIGFYRARGWTEVPESLRTEDAWGHMRDTVRYEKAL